MFFAVGAAGMVAAVIGNHPEALFSASKISRSSGELHEYCQSATDRATRPPDRKESPQRYP